MRAASCTTTTRAFAPIARFTTASGSTTVTQRVQAQTENCASSVLRPVLAKTAFATASVSRTWVSVAGTADETPICDASITRRQCRTDAGRLPNI